MNASGDASRSSEPVSEQELVARSAALFEQGLRLALVAGHDDGDALRVVYAFTAGPPDRRVELEVHLDSAKARIPSLAALSFPASRFERELHDLFGIVPVGHPFLRRLVRHQHWPEDWHPMRRDATPAPTMLADAAPFPFVQVDGPGVYEIPVGPVHAGLIEPGHFRFSVVGETILKMKARLWFVHRGVERLFEGRSPDAGVELAARVAGDTTVGHTLAYCLALEEALGCEIDPRAQAARALVLELERCYNHVADLGALCNDVGFGLAQARALVIRERLLRLNESLTGHRLLRGAVVPGGCRLERLPGTGEIDELEELVDDLVALARANSVVMERFRGTAVLAAEDATGTGTIGVVARASGLGFDARASHPFVAPPEGFAVSCEPGGDVLARFDVRVRELGVSFASVRALASGAAAPDAPVASSRRRGGSGLGIVEGWRGAIVHRVEVGPSGTLTRVKVVDPSFLNWPALSVALADTIVPDFPLANKSFNLSYAGNDL